MKCDEQNRKVIKSQKTIIDLQAEVIKKSDLELASVKRTVKEELKSVQTTVQSEMNSYSSVLPKTCSAALSQRKLQCAVKLAAEKEDRSRNVVIYGVKEEAEEILHDKSLEILQDTYSYSASSTHYTLHTSLI